VIGEAFMQNQKRIEKHLLGIFSITFIIIAFLANLSLLTMEENTEPLTPTLTITAQTNKQSYLLRQKIYIQGNITLDGTPVSDAYIILQINNPQDQPTTFRTIQIGNPTQHMPIKILDISITDHENNQLDTVQIGTSIRVIVKVNNPELTSQNIFITATVFDANMVPIQTGFLETTILPEQTISPKFTIYIPKWAISGKALICANVYNKEPKQGGIAYAKERAEYFYISKIQKGYLELPEIQFQDIQNTPGKYQTYITLPPDPKAGEYTAYITGQVDPITINQETITFQVQQSSGYPPQASFAYWPTPSYENMTLTFDASSSTAEGFNDTIIKYEWDFGDGTPKIIKEGNYTNPPDPTVTHAYTTPGNYTITLNVTDNEGLWSTTTKPIEILPEFGPTADFEWSPYQPWVNQTITFNASKTTLGWCAKTARFSPIANYTWDFGDGTSPITITNPIITYNYTQPGNYSVTLTVTDEDGRIDSVTYIVEVLNITTKYCDINGDGIIDLVDVYTVAMHYATEEGDPNYDPRCDINNDGMIDLFDYYTVCMHYGEDP